MFLSCWSVKGGSGTTVVAASLALLSARKADRPALLVDLAGDAAPALGVSSSGPGVTDWLRAGDDVPATALRRLEIEVAPGVALLPFGESDLPAGVEPARAAAHRLAEVLRADTDRAVFVDAGRVDQSVLGGSVVGESNLSLLVVRPCYLALRRAVAAPQRPTGIVLVDEAERALDVVDIEEALGAPVVAVVPQRPEIARAVDAGLLAGRLPKALASALRRAA